MRKVQSYYDIAVKAIVLVCGLGL